MLVKCPKCGALISDTEKSCHVCGGQIEQEQQYCSNCDKNSQHSNDDCKALEFNTKLNVENVREICGTLRPKIAYVMITACSIMLFFYIIIIILYGKATTLSDILPAIFLLFALIYSIVFTFVTTTKLNTRRFIETSNGNDIVYYHYVFDESKIVIHNLTTNGEFRLLYSMLKRYKESEHYLTIITKANMYFVIDKTQADNKQLTRYLDTKMRKNCKR